MSQTVTGMCHALVQIETRTKRGEQGNDTANTWTLLCDLSTQLTSLKKETSYPSTINNSLTHLQTPNTPTHLIIFQDKTKPSTSTPHTVLFSTHLLILLMLQYSTRLPLERRTK